MCFACDYWLIGLIRGYQDSCKLLQQFPKLTGEIEMCDKREMNLLQCVCTHMTVHDLNRFYDGYDLVQFKGSFQNDISCPLNRNCRCLLIFFELPVDCWSVQHPWCAQRQYLDMPVEPLYHVYMYLYRLTLSGVYIVRLQPKNHSKWPSNEC